MRELPSLETGRRLDEFNPTPRIQLSVRLFVRSFVCLHFLHASYIVIMMVWVTRPERPKGGKDETSSVRYINHTSSTCLESTSVLDNHALGLYFIWVVKYSNNI